MKARRLSEIRVLLTSAEFTAWWGELEAARAALAKTEQQREEMLAQLTLTEFRAELTQKNAIDTLYQAGEHEDAAARYLVESAELENRSFPGVAAFEEQRFKVSELWYRLGAAERALEVARSDRRSTQDLPALERRRQQLSDEYERENGRKNQLWQDVERLWDRSMQVGLLTTERRAQARKVRHEAEKLFGLADERKKQVTGLKGDSDFISAAVESAHKALAARRDAAGALFQCTVGTDFLFFRQWDEARRAFAVSLVDDATHYNLEVKRLTVYSVDRQTGVGFLEPARESSPSVEESDRRFESYFLTGRKGTPARITER